jgi:hypothetical protein
MRNTLITGPLLCLPTAALLASVSLAVLVGKLRRRLRRAVNHRFAAMSILGRHAAQAEEI